MAGPSSAILVELDDALVRLLDREIAGATVGCGTPQVAADASAAHVNLFLYDVREAAGGRSMQWITTEEGDEQRRVGPPLRLAVTYAATAHAADTRAEHALLSEVLGVLDAHRVLPADVLTGGLAESARQFAVETLVAAAPAEKRLPSAGLAVAVRVLVTLEPARRTARGPLVRAPVVRMASESAEP